ncbi:pyruvate kinase [Texas Phoenix palm phytoplasma]|uniref:Pyruvate kinase n=1 Tax=Texas Phoenix palm phytoplasma TaxID=176709 RepID=A0ABS5BI94_9MOLU|nr:pyruvate kinase [Texas Phoenix palm phytoplasma]MBP3059301.1 pyruvate kinase [Texas Phoenix palm phytoplasma]
MNKTKIICTLGPASYEKKILKKLILSGMNIARFNFSHANYEQSKLLIKTIKELNKELKTNVSILLDTKGPEIRTHEFEKLTQIKKNSIVRITSKEIIGNEKIFSVNYKNFFKELKIGDLVFVDDGYLSLKVIDKDKEKKELITKAENTHSITSRRGINVPNVNLKMDFLSKKDIEDIKFAVKENYDFIASSFTRTPKDIQEIKNILKDNKNQIKIIAKIENQSGINNLDEILEIADGIMVARGDLGIEVDGELVPFYQSTIIQKCLKKGKPVIVATQMLESMQKNPRPTKAEISDVFNAVKEGTTATMLSGESASGKYPIQSVQYMKKINNQSEKTLNYKYFSNLYKPKNFKEELLLNAVQLALNITAKAIIVYSFEDALNISKFHPSICVFAIIKNDKQAKILSLNFGIIAVLDKKELINKIQFSDQKEKELLIFINENKIEIKNFNKNDFI